MVVYWSPTFIGFNDYALFALKLQEQQQFQTAEDAVVCTDSSNLISSLDHILPESFHSLGNALILSLPEPPPGQKYGKWQIRYFSSLLLYHVANKRYIESLVETLYPSTLLQQYPTLTSANVSCHNPGHNGVPTRNSTANAGTPTPSFHNVPLLYIETPGFHVLQCPSSATTGRNPE